MEIIQSIGQGVNNPNWVMQTEIQLYNLSPAKWRKQRELELIAAAQCNEKFLIYCSCDACRRERVRRIISAAVWELDFSRNELNRLTGKMPHVLSMSIRSDGGYAAREAAAMWGGL